MESTPRNQMRQLAAQNYGILCVSDLELAGIDRRYRHRMCFSGELERLSQSVYRLGGVPSSWKGDLLALCWAQTPHGWVSHRSAARLWGLPDFNDRVLDVIVPRHSRRPRITADFRLHESAILPGSDGTTLKGIPITTPARTIIDLAAVVGDERLEYAVESVLRLKLCTIADIEEVQGRVCGQGRRGTQNLRVVVDRQLGRDRPIDSVTNVRLRRLLLGAGLPEPEMEFEVVVAAHKYFADLAYPKQNLLIECVSESYHLRRLKYSMDNTRRNRLLTAGWIVLEFTWHQVFKAPDACIAEIRDAFRAAGWSPRSK